MHPIWQPDAPGSEQRVTGRRSRCPAPFSPEMHKRAAGIAFCALENGREQMARKGVSKIRSPDDQRSFASWKFEVQKAMMWDERLNATAFRIGVYILSCVNAQSMATYVTDETIGLLVPGCRSRTTIYKARKCFTETGWMSIQEGRSGRATVYRINDKNVNAILDVVASKRDWRDAERQKKRLRGDAPNPVLGR